MSNWRHNSLVMFIEHNSIVIWYAVRALTALSSLFYICSGFIALFDFKSSYTLRIVGIYVILLGILCFFLDFSPYTFSLLSNIFPQIGEHSFRGFFHIGLGLLSLGYEFTWIGTTAGSILIILGAFDLVIRYVWPQLSPNYEPSYAEEFPRYPEYSNPVESPTRTNPYGEIP